MSGTRIVPIIAIMDTIDEAESGGWRREPEGEASTTFLVGGREATDASPRVSAPGASVSKVAQRYGVNANLLFTWRRQGAAGVAKATELLPVKVADEPTPAPTSPPGPMPLARAGRMEIALVGGERIVVGADVDAAALARVVQALSRR